jgi:hypothetical protein
MLKQNPHNLATLLDMLPKQKIMIQIWKKLQKTKLKFTIYL